MLKRSILSVVVLLASVAVLLLGAYLFRAGMLRIATNALLDADTVVLSDVQGVELGSRGASVAELDILLPASGLRVVVSDLRLSYALGELLFAGKAQSLGIAAIALSRQQPATEQPDTPGTALALSDLLLLLGNFPVDSLEVGNINIPDRDEALAVTVQRQDGSFSVNVVSGALQLLATAQLPAATEAGNQQQSAATLRLLLANAGTTVADVQLDVQPAAAGYRVMGTARADIPDFAELLGDSLLEMLGLPLASLQLDLALDADLADAFLEAPPARFSVQIQGGSALSLRDGVVDGLEQLTLRIAETAQLDFATGNAAATGSGRLPLALTGNWQRQPFDAELVFDIADCQLQAGPSCALAFAGSAGFDALVIAGEQSAPADALVISDLDFSAGGSVSLAADTLLVTLNSDSQVSGSAATSRTLQLAGFTLTTAAPLLIGTTLDFAAAVTLEGLHINGALTQLVVGGYTLDTGFSLRDIRFVSGAAQAGEAKLQTQDLRVAGSAWLPGVDVDATLQLQNGALTFATPLLFRGAPADPGVSLRGTYQIDSGNAVAALHVPPLKFAGPGTSLASYVGGWPFTFDVMTGTLGADLAVEWNAGDAVAATTLADDSSEPAASGVLTGTLNATFEDAAGYYGEMFFAGLDTQLDAAIDTAAPLPVTTPPLALRIATFDVGVPLTDIAVDFQVDGAAQTVNIAAFSAALLGGALSGENVRYDFGSERNFLNLQFTGLRLDHMLELVEYDGIEVFGAVSGELPLAITQSGVEVEEGSLSADAPGGRIRYLDGPTAGSGGNLGVDLVNQALGNYQFDSLESSIDYSPEGELLLGMQMQGHNPDMNNGQRINLNLNLSNNIPDLLDSLQAGRAIEEFLEGQYGPQPAAEPVP